MGILTNYLRIINNDSPRKDRCTVSEKWNAFIDGIGKVSLYCSEPEKTIDDNKRWLTRQVAPTLAKVVMADASFDFIEFLIDNGFNRLTPNQLEILNALQGGTKHDVARSNG